jgi:hypothetical protein
MKTLATLMLVIFAGPALAHGDDPPTNVVQGANEIDSPLAQKVRRATARFRDIDVARAEGYSVQVPCASGPGGGAMGVHLVNPALLGSKEIDAETPEALMYEPQPNGRMRLVGVEYLTLADNWVGELPVLEGHLPHFAGAPNRYGLPAFYELHIWAWRNNPSGLFADFNSRVTCAKQPLPQ